MIKLSNNDHDFNQTRALENKPTSTLLFGPKWNFYSYNNFYGYNDVTVSQFYSVSVNLFITEFNCIRLFNLPISYPIYISLNLLWLTNTHQTFVCNAFGCSMAFESVWNVSFCASFYNSTTFSFLEIFIEIKTYL